ncbi:class I SAM-dependent methyltransferase [Oscillospiraceae bacterium OttesenSCG-928-F05]|nr:class I SAM-dependent methyltransferase [Oscillospiraceae bacterium OttesenSCG-928-F05]
MAYDYLPAFYDALTEDVDYAKTVRYLERRFEDARIPVRAVLDLACGTGTVAHALAEKGYDVVAVDGSDMMLAEAAAKGGGENPPLFLQQPMDALDLYGTVDAAVCTLDGLNHLTEEAALRETLRRVHMFLNPGGVFVFDIYGPMYLRSLDGTTFSDEREDVFCVWRIAESEKKDVYAYTTDLFIREAGRWARRSETHFERAYEAEAMEYFLSQAGFEAIGRFDGRSDTPAAPETRRIYFSARKPER